LNSLPRETRLVKKKIVEAAKPVALRQIVPLQFKSRSQSGQKEKVDANHNFDTKLIIEQSILDKIKPAKNTSVAETQGTGNMQQATGNLKPETANLEPATGKISALDKIRKQYQGNGSLTNENINQPLQEDALQRAWIDYVQKLKDARNPAAQSFELASLRIKDENSFEAVTANNIEQKFIEQDRNKVFAYLQEKLNNRLLQFNVVIEENPDLRPRVEVPLSSKEQLQKMIEQYPLVKELKDKLKLDLDY